MARRVQFGREAMLYSLLRITALVLGVSACSSSAPNSADRRETPEPPPEGVVQLSEASARFITVAPASGGDHAPATLGVPARVVLRENAISRVGAPLSGRVLEVHVQLGDVVSEGDPLVTLRSPDAAAARAALSAATAALQAARQQAERTERLIAQGVGTERERVEAEARIAELTAEVARARTTVGYVGRGTGATVVVRAPIAGTVLTRSATSGAAVEPGGEPLVEIGDPLALWVEADVFERDLAMIERGATAQLTLPNRSQPIEGRVVHVGSVVSTDTRTAPVRIEVDADASLRPGMFGRARITIGTRGIALPTRAVLIDGGRRYIVYVARDERTFERRPVEIGLHLDGHVQILSGLSGEEQVVVDGALLVDGSADVLL